MPLVWSRLQEKHKNFECFWNFDSLMTYFRCLTARYINHRRSNFQLTFCKRWHSHCFWERERCFRGNSELKCNWHETEIGHLYIEVPLHTASYTAYFTVLLLADMAKKQPQRCKCSSIQRFATRDVIRTTKLLETKKTILGGWKRLIN